MNAFVIDQLEVGTEDDVLEVGFGGGALLEMLLDATRGQVVGVDISPEMVERARKRFAGEARARILEGSVDRLPLDTASVDRACSVNNLYFWPSLDAGLRELSRVIRPGGLLSVAFEPPEELAKWPGSRFGFRTYAEEEVRSGLMVAGFHDLRSAEGTGRKPDRFLCLTGERRQAGPAS